MRSHLCLHDDERLWPVQRDKHNRVCDVYSDQHKMVYLDHFNHSASFFLQCFGIDDVNVSRGIRAMVSFTA